MYKNKKTNVDNKLMILVRDYSKPIQITEDNKELIPVKWVEVKEVNLGSQKYPARDIFKVKV